MNPVIKVYILALLKWCFEKSYFQINDVIYESSYDFIMGNPLRPLSEGIFKNFVVIKI